MPSGVRAARPGSVGQTARIALTNQAAGANLKIQAMRQCSSDQAEYYERRPPGLWLRENHRPQSHKKLLEISGRFPDSFQFWICLPVASVVFARILEGNLFR